MLHSITFNECIKQLCFYSTNIVVLQLMEDGENGASGLHVQLHVEMAPKTGIDIATILHQTMEG